MRVAIIITRVEDLGPVKVIQNLANSLVKFKDLSLRIYYLDKKTDPKIMMNLAAERLNRRTFPFNNFDIIHTNGIRPDLFAFLNRKKIRFHISTIHNFVFADLAFTYNRFVSMLFGFFWILLWKRADKLVCISNTQLEYYEKWFKASKLHVIYNGIAESASSSSSEDDIIKSLESFRLAGLKILGCAGKLTRRKGIDQLLNLVASEKNVALIIFGDGKELSSLKQLSERLKVKDRSRFCGFVSEAVRYFRFCDLFVVPSRSEGFCLVLSEAVQQRVPVICSDINVFKELFSPEEVTFFKLDDMISLKETVETAFPVSKEKADKAYKRYRLNYTADLMTLKYYEMYLTGLSWNC